MATILEICEVSKAYEGDVVLDDISLALSENEYMSLLGPSGSGKSTLLKAICGFERLEHGEIFLDGEPITDIPAYRRGIGFVSQGFALFPHMTVFENVAFGLRYREEGAIADEREVERRVGDILDLVKLSELGGRNIAQISGGQKQRVALARTLVTNPKVILLDEPLGALDANLRTRMRVELRRIRQKLGVSFMHVTGNEQEALAMGDRVVVLDSGHIIQVSDSDTLYNHPVSAQVARLLDSYNLFPGVIGAENLFHLQSTELACSDDDGRKTGGEGVYCIRYDKIHVAHVDQDLAADEVGLRATYITSEYSGPNITYFFKRADEHILEVVYYLSHKRPEDFTVGSDYSLIWKIGDSIVFD